MPEMLNVYSTRVDAIGYDKDKQELYIEWAGGFKTSIYEGIDEDLANETINSWSIGKQIQDKIIGKFPHRYKND
jgi:hypothetical protein